MPNTNKTQQGQSFIDMCLQETGNIANIVKMAYLNDRAISSAIKIGDIFQRPAITDSNTVRFFTPVNNRPATDFTYSPVTLPKPQEGISFWVINDDFIVTPSGIETP